MFRQSGSSRAISADIGEIERRLRSLEKQLERIGSRTSASASPGRRPGRRYVATALSSMAERFRGGANSRRQAAKISSEAAQIGNEAANSATMPCAVLPTKSSSVRWSRSQSRSGSAF